MNKIFIAILTLGFLWGCQPTKITRTWTAENVTPKKFKKILVLSVLPENEKSLGSEIENHLADDLRNMGYVAIAANKIYQEGTFVKGDTAKAEAAIEGKGFDGILTIVLLDKKKEKYYVPGRITDYSDMNKYSRFDRYYNAVAENIYSPGYYGEETKYVWENNFYDLANREMIYSARTRSFDFTSKTMLAHKYGILMSHNFINRNILLKPESIEE